ncbi:HAD hydrolase subfamily IA REG-2-like protein [Pisolithus microcarpus]|nr:HAD hydrolase subfamily IA REG-2-like protein [Pisolithus microcarpus]
MVIKLVTFDALHTLLTPRRPIYVQYSEVFAPFLGALDPDRIRHSFKSSLKQIQKEKPVYKGQAGVLGWWTEVIKGTAIGAGARPQVVEESLGQIVPVLMKRFSSREGYKLFDDALPVLWQLRKMNVRTALVSNADSRMRLVLDDLDVSSLLQPLLLSDEMFRMAQKDVALQGSICADESLHVGDELYRYLIITVRKQQACTAMLLRRPGPDGDGERKEVGEDLRHLLNWVKNRNVDLGTATR